MMRKYTLLFLLLITLLTKHSQCKQKMRLYTFYTSSHQVFKDQWFLPSIKDNFDIRTKFVDQYCLTAEFKDKGWNKTMLFKVNLIIKGIKENWGKIFIYSDIDVQFFRPIQPLIAHLMKDNDLIIQRNNPSGELCAGFFACRGNKKTLKLWQQIRNLMLKQGKRDQQGLNTLLRKKNKLNIVWDYLPAEFFGGGTLTGKRWDPGDVLPVPKNIAMHHANYTLKENKIAQLEYVMNIAKEYQQYFDS